MARGVVCQKLINTQYNKVVFKANCLNHKTSVWVESSISFIFQIYVFKQKQKIKELTKETIMLSH